MKLYSSGVIWQRFLSCLCSGFAGGVVCEQWFVTAGCDVCVVESCRGLAGIDTSGTISICSSSVWVDTSQVFAGVVWRSACRRRRGLGSCGADESFGLGAGVGAAAVLSRGAILSSLALQPLNQAWWASPQLGHLGVVCCPFLNFWRQMSVRCFPLHTPQTAGRVQRAL